MSSVNPFPYNTVDLDAFLLGSCQRALTIEDRYRRTSAEVWTNWETARTYYRLSAPQLSGVWTVSIADPADSETVTSLNIDYGIREDSPFGQKVRAELPKVNGVEVHGGTFNIDTDKLDQLNHRTVNCHRVNSVRRYDFDASQAHKARMAAILRAIAKDYLNRPDLERLHDVAARLEAPELARRQTEKIGEIEAQLAELHAELERRKDLSRRYLALQGMPVAAECHLGPAAIEKAADGQPSTS